MQATGASARAYSITIVTVSAELKLALLEYVLSEARALAILDVDTCMVWVT